MARLVTRIVACLSVVVIQATGASAAPQRTVEPESPDAAVRVRVTPHALTAPGHLTGLVRVAAGDGPRVLRVVLDSEAFYRSSDIQLDGRGAARSHFLEWGALPAGTYRVIVSVAGADGVHTRVSRELQVIGPER